MDVNRGLNESNVFEFTVEQQDAKQRLDFFLSKKIEFSRNYVSKLISDEHIFVNDKKIKPSYKLKFGDSIRGRIPEIRPLCIEPENIELDVLFEDEYLAVINKPYGMVVHPSPGHEKKTLVNALLYHFDNISQSGDSLRPGIVHRLDKDTSGAIIIAKKQKSLELMCGLFKERNIKKSYLALVHGTPSKKGVVEKTIGRHPSYRKKMCADVADGRYSLSCWNVIKYYGDLSLIEVEIKTGRTHQIRVHMASEGFPLVGDEIYGFKHPMKHIQDDNVKVLIKSHVKRQMLHSYRLSFTHPLTGAVVDLKAPVSQDMNNLLLKLDEYYG